MERLFSPCTRYRDLVESRGDIPRYRGPPDLLEELNLDVSTDELLSAERGFTYADLYATLGNTEYSVLWLTPHAAVVPADATQVSSWGQMDGSLPFYFYADGKRIFVLARSPEHLLGIFDVVVRLLVASVVHTVLLRRRRRSRDGVLINVASLAYLMEQCQTLKLLSLQDLEMDENHCRALGAYSRPDLDILLINCAITSAGTGALVEVLGRNQGPTKLDCCDIDNFVLVDGLRGNSRLKRFIPRLS
jgi:hypothetical protein